LGRTEGRPFRKILIANRGEIAVRVFRAAWDLGIDSVAVYSSVDRTAPHVRLAHEAYEIGRAPATDSYLRIDRLLDVARKTGAEAIHPGYGFLAENPEFAEACKDAGLKFIGPSADAMRLVGDKVRAREVMQKAGVPVLPGTGAFRGSPEEALSAADEIGYPVIVKAAGGGGGKGMRIVCERERLVADLERARSEARASFGNETVYIEKYISRARHIEVQIVFDEHGSGVALGERECSIQRRHQKLVEETPAPGIDDATRSRIQEIALTAGATARYAGAGTVEFLFDDAGNFYFIEMNTRLQVEHPVTEQVYGIDLVEAQIRIAAGEELPWTKDQIAPRGHSIECRITAEDPHEGFVPRPGRIEAVRIPSGPGVRDDSAVAPGYSIPVEYDPMIGKLTTYGADRIEAIQRMRRALDEYRLVGLTTIIPFLRRLMDHEKFIEGDLHTGFIDEHAAELLRRSNPRLDDIAVVAAAIHAYEERVAQSLRSDMMSGGGESPWLRSGRARTMRGGR